ncbi:hypothetical protein DPMN_016888 [Dreissena polymorpha]|uniref:Uncharacterized protein n=1 Tax=Dreissena polymorpha TaxID=45954 RepID=A0A9D4NC45_DREPO|nr:hypothetical protein DPMN_016888 [Dreissena polymorpha]
MRNKSDLSRKVYKGLANIYKAELSSVKDEYSEDKIGNAEGNKRKLHTITSELLGRSKENPLPYSHSIQVKYL